MEMPEEMRKALYGASSTDEKRDSFLEFVQPIPNPWTPRSADDKRVMFEGEDDEEKQYSEVHQPLERIFRGVPDTVTSEPAERRFRFSKNPSAPADQPLEKRTPKPEPKDLRYEKVMENGEMVSKGYDPVSGELKSYIVLLSEHEIE